MDVRLYISYVENESTPVDGVQAMAVARSLIAGLMLIEEVSCRLVKRYVTIDDRKKRVLIQR